MDRKMKTSTSTALTEGSIVKKIIAFAIPLFWGNLFQQMYNMADSLIVGNCLGDIALAAVTSTGSLIFLLVGFFNGTAMGAGVVIGRYFGAKDYNSLKRAVHTDVAFGMIAGVFMTILGVFFTPTILGWMGTPTDVFAEAVLYLRVYFLGSLAVIMYNICMGILHAVGDSKHPLYYLIFSSCVNVVLDLIFCGLFRRGVEFAALATVISQFVSVVLCMRRLTRVEDVYQIKLKEVRIDAHMLRQIITFGLPSGMQNSIISIANIVVQSNINAFGTVAMAGCGSYAKLEGFAFLPITCFTMALTTFVSQNLGAKEYDRVKKGAVFGVSCTLLLAEIVGVLIFMLAPFVIGIFGGGNEAIAYGVLQAKHVALFYFLLAFSHSASAILRGAGKSIVPMLVMLVAWCLIRVSYVTIVGRLFDDIRLIFIAYPITWTISSVIFLIYLLKTDWIHNFERQGL